MDDPIKESRWWMYWGIIPQMTMLACFAATSILYGRSTEGWVPVRVIDAIGAAVFLYCLFVLYLKPQEEDDRHLITTGPFKYTRHPMYTGIFLMSLEYWLPRPASSDTTFYLLQAMFMVTLVVAGWFQEQETLARYGEDAEIYYRRTPRIFFMYPFRRAA